MLYIYGHQEIVKCGLNIKKIELIIVCQLFQVSNFVNKGIDMSLRVASLDYLGVVAARLRKDAVLSQQKLNTIDQIISEIKAEEQKELEDSNAADKKVVIELISFLKRVYLKMAFHLFNQRNKWTTLLLLILFGYLQMFPTWAGCLNESLENKADAQLSYHPL